MPVGAAVGAGVAGVASAGASVIGANKQASAANKSADTQMQMYQQSRSDLLPYNTAGQAATTQLSNRLADLTSPINMDEATLQKTPGYAFNLNQGLKATQNSAAARGLGNSGAALKGAASYATGLADSTYQQQFQNALTNKQTAYNMLSGVASLGENAAAQTGQAGTTAAGNAGNAYQAAGTATSAGNNGAANALTNGFTNYLSYNALTGGGMYGGPKGGPG